MVTINVPVNKKDVEGDEYEPVSFESCLSQLSTEEVLEFNCPNCKTKTEAIKSTGFLTFPQYLVTKMERMKLVNWVPQKLAIPIILSNDKIINLDNYRSKGLQEGEEELENIVEDEPAVNEQTVSQLMEMGFSRNRCIRAVMATDNNGAEVAMNWLFERMDDPSLDSPIEKKTKKNNNSITPNAENVALLVDMGFNSIKVEKALIETNNNIERAIDWLSSHFEDDIELTSDQSTNNNKMDEDQVDNKPAKYELIGFITHMGTSAQCGHYVIHLRHDNKWYLYNDEKVVKVTEDLPTQNAYMYLFKRL